MGFIKRLKRILSKEPLQENQCNKCDGLGLVDFMTECEKCDGTGIVKNNSDTEKDISGL